MAGGRKRIISMWMALALFGAALPVPASAEGSALPAQAEPAAGSGGSAYFSYYDQTVSVPFGEAILLEAGRAALDGGTPENGYRGEASSLLLEEDGEAVWTVTVPADARYIIRVTYVGEEDNRKDGSVDLLVDGEAPFEESRALPLTRVWKDATEIRQDAVGNDRIPDQEQILDWNTVALQDFTLFTDQPLCFFLTAGEHTITLKNTGEALHIARLELGAPAEVLSDEEAADAYAQAGYAEAEGYLQKLQAETPAAKSSQSIYPTYDRNSPATEPYHVSKIRRNTIGQSNWSEPGAWISYTVTVEEEGLYYLTLKYRQNLQIGASTFRSIYVNGEIPSASYENVRFPYGVNWNNKTIVDENGDPCPLYLQAGENEIRFQVTVGPWADVLRTVEESNDRLNQMYIEIVMITGTTPDKYRDYNLDEEIPDLIDCFTQERDRLAAAADEFDRLNGEKSTQSETVRRAVTQLSSMLEDPDSIPQRLSNYRDTISYLSSWVYDNMEQPLELDYILIHSADAELPSARAGFFASLKHMVGAFIASFTQDYNSMGGTEGAGTSITVWFNSGRDQGQILKDLLTDRFTPETGISVQLSLVQTGFIEATLAGTGPDVAIGVARGQPVNLACRGALADLSGFDTFDEVVERFSETATVPYQYNGGIYALPNTQTFFMMFYRTDILEQLGLSLPQTWEELFQIVPRLQKNHMQVGLPYSVISASTAVDNGLGAKDMFPVLLLQNGGNFYSEDATRTTLDTEAAMNAFNQWCTFYDQYGFELVYDFYTRFRNGEMPIAIAGFDQYNALTAGAPEIRGKWGMAPIPGTEQEDGSINRATGGAGSSVVMFEAAGDKEACWDFIDWWTRADTQETYGSNVENVMGAEGRNATANIEAFSYLDWTEEELTALEEQRQQVQELREIPGSYFVSRCLDNAFRAVLFDGKNAREEFERENDNINREIARKRNELGLD
ncbi:MAG TPA: extracellular solute-binding protein [Firmicutes bacterium]|nr:extracellular solute-binding protein [Bacillota bacterium]